MPYRSTLLEKVFKLSIGEIWRQVVGDPGLRLGEAVVEPPRDVVVGSRDPADHPPAALARQLAQVLEQRLARPAPAPCGVDEEVVEEASPVTLEWPGERADVREPHHLAAELGHEALELAALGDPAPQLVEIGGGDV